MKDNALYCWPEAILRIMKSEGMVEFRNEEVPFAVLDRCANPGLPGFVGCWKMGEEKFFFISEDVPTCFRVPILLHEMQECIVHKEAPGSCQRALLYELAYVHGDLYGEYILYRKKFFDRLLPYCVANKYPEQRIRDMEESLNHLTILASSER